MKNNATHLPTFGARATCLLLAGAGLLTAVPAMAQEDVTENTPSMREVAMTPLNDLNLAQDPIPPVLLEARADPYADRGLAECSDIRREIADLDAVLGDDFDTRSAEERDLTPTGVAQKVIGYFIPFRGIIREISGANDHEYDFREAIAAGLMRRAYLKGMGQQMDCPYPARPAPPEMLSRLGLDKEFRPGEYEAEALAATANDGTTFVSQPVVQDAD